MLDLAYRIINIVYAFTPFCLLLHHCQSKNTEKVSSNYEFVTILYNYSTGILTYPIVVDDLCCHLAQDFHWFIGERLEIFIPFCDDSLSRWSTFENFVTQSFCNDSAYNASVNHRVRDDFIVLDSCIKRFKLICSITRDICHIVISVTIIVGIVNLIIGLLITSYVVNRFFFIIFVRVCVNLIDDCL